MVQLKYEIFGVMFSFLRALKIQQFVFIFIHFQWALNIFLYLVV